MPKSFKKRTKAKRVPKSMCMLYGLVGSDGIVRYVGQTRSPLSTRLSFHKKNAFIGGASPVCKWIVRECGEVDIIPLDYNATWDVSEILLIDQYRRDGHHLWNVTRGGPDTISDVRREGCFPESHKAEGLVKVHAKAEALGIEIIQAIPKN